MSDMPGRVVVLDHDGPLTFIRGYTQEFAQQLCEDFPSLGAPNDDWLQLENHIQQLGADPERTIQLVHGSPPAGRAATDSLVAAQLATRELLQSDPGALAALAALSPDGNRGGTVVEYTTALHHKFKASAASYREGVEA